MHHPTLVGGVSSTGSMALSKKRHGHRRKAATPLRAPEAASPEWYNEVQLPLLVARLLNTDASHHASHHHHHRHRRRSSSLSPSASTSSLDSASGAAATNGGEGNVCSRCASEKTPMWRRMGGVLLCNACGLRARRAAATQTRDELVAAGKGRVVAAAEAAVAAANGENAFGRSRLSKASTAHHQQHLSVAVAAAAAPVAPAAPASAASDATAVGGETDGENEAETEQQQQQLQQQQPCLATTAAVAFAAVGA